MKRLTLIAVMPLLLTACGGGDESAEAGETVTVTVAPDVFEESTPAEAESTEASEEPDAFAPNLGESALEVGETRVGKAIETTLIEIAYPLPPAQYREPARGNVFLGLHLEQCLNADANGRNDSTYNGDWSAVTPSGNEFSGDGSSWDDWPSPKFNEYVSLIPGRCLKGWIAMEVPEGTKITSILWRPEGVATAEWIPKRG